MARPIKHRGKWRIRWTDQNGRRHSEVFEDHCDAVFSLRAREQDVSEILRGLKLGVTPDKTFAEVCDYWIAHRAPQKRSRKHDESIIRCHLRPTFGSLLVKDLGVESVDRFVGALGRLDRKTISNVLTLLLSMLHVAVDLGWLAKVPRIRKPRVRLIPADFAYLRSEEEIIRFLRAARAEGEDVFTLYAMAIYTGMRAGELAGLLWSDVDLERRLITVQRSYDGPTKADDVRYVPILDPLLPVLRAWRLLHPGRQVFTNRDGRMFLPSSRVFQEVLRRVLYAAGFKAFERKGRHRPYVVFHDLRHTFASHWVMRGGDLFKLQKILGHKTVQMTLRYAHMAPSAFAAEYGRLGCGPALQSAEVMPMPFASPKPS